MKRTLSLRNQLSIWLALLVLLQSAALIMALIFSNVFLLLDADAFLKLKNTTQMRSEGVNAAFGQVVYNVATQTRRLNEELLLLAQTNGYELQGIYQNDASYEETVLVAGESVLSLLRNNQVTGAFFLLNGSNKNVENGNAHAGIYLRNSTPGGSGQGQENLLLEMGPVSVAKEYHIPTSIRWSLDILLEQEDPRASIYTKPIWASKEKPKVSLEHYGYWSKPMDILRDNRFVVCHSLPVFDENGQAFAVLGIELDVTYFTQTYLSSADLMYPNSFYIITEQQAGELPLSWLIPGGPLAQVYLQEKNSQSLSSVNAGVEEIYRTSIHGLGKMYSVVAPLSVYSKNSPFAGEDWSLVSFVPQDELHHGTIVVRQNLLISIVVTTLLSFVVIFIIIYFATRKIAGLSKYVSALSPYDEIRIRRTGMQEIDELSAAVEMLNESVINASKTTSKILDMSLLPIGGFERLEEQNHVVVTSYVRELLHLEAAKQLSIADWDVLFQQLMAEPLANYENVYQYQQKNGTSQETLFLRIVETTAPTGTVGVILDVTRDIQEQRRLAHELDYDSLTHLYNRIAFKREVNRQICGQPGKVGAMIFADIDNLKYINDTFGHDAGDRLIMRAGERFREFVAFACPCFHGFPG